MQADQLPTASEAGAPRDERIAEIISEFSEVFAFARTRWTRYAEEVHADLRGVGMMVLQLVLRKGPVTATGISQMLDMDKAMVSRQVAKLRELGLVDAEPAAEDRRVMLLTASAEARRLLDGIRERWAEAYHERFGGWSVEDLELLRDVLHRFNASAEGPQGPAARCTQQR